MSEAKIKWLSQLGQDKFIVEKIFNNKKGGTFVEVGAHDGIHLSNTASLERHFDWGGLCIEPSRSSANIIRERKSKMSNACISPLEFENQIVRLREHSSRELSVTLFEDLLSPPHLAKELEMKENGYWDRLKKCKTLDSVLGEYGIDKDIDYISIDTRGSEWLAIKDFPLKKWNVKVFSIANDMFQGGEKKKNRDNVKSLMENNGYKLEKVFTLSELKKGNWGKDFDDKILEDLYVKQDS